MKSIINRIIASFMLCVMMLAVCGSTNTVSAYELIATVDGEEMKIDAKDATYEWRKNIRGKPLKITGKASKGDFMSIEFISSECEILDMSDLEIDVIPHQSFLERDNLRKVILPKSLKKIEPVCFSHCYKLETVVLPDSLREIGHGSFMACPKLKLEVPSRVKCGEDVFDRSPGATIVEAEPDPLCGWCLWLLDWMRLGSQCDEKKDV